MTESQIRERAEALAQVMTRLWKDGHLRAQLAARGRRRIQGLTWEHTARFFRALYRKVAGQALSREDARLLAKGQTSPK